MEERKTPVGGNPQHERSRLQGAVQDKDGEFLPQAGRSDPFERRLGFREIRLIRLGLTPGDSASHRRTVEKRTFLNRLMGTEVRSTFD